VHEDIKKELDIDISYYRLLPDMISEEFDKEISNEERENIEELDKAAKINDILANIDYPNEEIQKSLEEFNEKNKKIQETFAKLSLSKLNFDTTELNNINKSLKNSINLKTKEVQDAFKSLYLDNQKLKKSLKNISIALYSDNQENED
jgi:hypothetical protein